MLHRTIALCLALALLATVVMSAQCVVRCATPMPKCHHHAPEKSKPCADNMQATVLRPQVAVVLVAIAESPIKPAPQPASSPANAEPALAPSPHPEPPHILRI